MMLRPPVAVALALLLILSLAGITPSMTLAEQVDESIPSGFQVYTCPENYEGLDYLNDCDPVGAGDYAITVTDTHPTESTAITETDADGFITFLTVPGETTWSLRTYESGAYYVSCFDGDGIYLFDGRQAQIRLNMAEGDELSCRWYVTPLTGGTSSIDLDNDPADATVGVQVFDCPEGFESPTRYLADYRQACAPTGRPVDLTLNDGYDIDEATMIFDQAGDDGRAGFVNLLEGTYVLALADLSPTTAIFHVCTDATRGSFSDGHEMYGTRGTHNRIRLPLYASDDVSCEIYLMADGPLTSEPGSPGTVTLSVLNCPESFNGPDWAAACTRPIDSNYAFMIDSADQGDSGFGDPADGVEIFQGVAVFEDVSSREVQFTTGIPGHGAEFASGCVSGAGPVPDDAIGLGTLVTVQEGDGLSCTIYVIPESFRA